jgi:Domain of unknown function (DUF4214)/Divergent InlB B-repeat domain
MFRTSRTCLTGRPSRSRPTYRAAPAILLIASGLLSTLVAAAPFTPGNVVVYRVGTGTGNLVATGNPVFLDEFATGAPGAAVNTIALPSTGSGAQKALVASGTAAPDGLLTRSANGNCLAVPGYGRDLGTGTGNLATTGTITGGLPIPRIVGRVMANGTVDTSTALTTFALQSNYRGATSSDCGSFWVAGVSASGTSQGVHFVSFGATTSTDLTSSTLSNVRSAQVVSNQLYASAAGTGFRGVHSIGTGLPIGTAAPSRLPGLTDTNVTSANAFVLLSVPSGGAINTLYIADDGAGVSKFSLVSGTWVSNGIVGVAADTYRGLAGTVSGSTVTLYATRKGGTGATGGGELVKITDASGFNGTFSATPVLLATAATNTAFRGVALTPEVTVTPSAGMNGSISPATPQVVGGGATASFTVTPDMGYVAVVTGTCGGTLTGSTYVTNAVATNCSVDVNFTLQVTYQVTPSATGNGTISPSTAQTVVSGSPTSFTVTPNAGHSVQMGGTCMGTLSGTTYSIASVNGNCTVTATFAPITYQVTPSKTGNGTITPNTVQTVNALTTTTFSVVPDSGQAATVGGTCGGTLTGTSYVTNSVTAPCTVQVTFAPLPVYAVTVNITGPGMVSPSGTQMIAQGSTANLTVTPNAGYKAAVRGTCGGALSGSSYVSAPVTGACSVNIAFARKLVLFQGNSFTFGRVDPVMSYNTANVTDLTDQMWRTNDLGSNPDEPHPWGGIPGVFKKFTDQLNLDYDVSISARNAASMRGHFLNSNPAGWDLRGNIASQRWDIVVLQDLSDQPLPAGRSPNANLPYFRAYADKMQRWIHQGAAHTFTETDLIGGGSDAACAAATGASVNSCNTVRTISPANANANPAAEIYLYATWARADMIGPSGTKGPTPGSTYYSAAEGMEAMTRDLSEAYHDQFARNGAMKAVNPVGDAFLRAVTEGYAVRDPYIPVPGRFSLWWDMDYFHPSKYGSYLSALVHLAMITGTNPRTLGPNELAAIDLGISSQDAVNLQEVARLTVLPFAPANPVATAGTLQVSVAFTAPNNVGRLPLTGYTVNCGGATATGTGSPIVVTGVAARTTVACTVAASNAIGLGPAVTAPAVSVAGQMQSITFNTLADKVFGDAPVALTATASSSLPVTFASTTLPTCEVANNAVTLTGAGVCTIVAQQSGSTVFSAAPGVERSFTITKRNQVITFPTVADRTLGIAPFDVTVSVNSALAARLNSLSPAVCRFDPPVFTPAGLVYSNRITLLATGVCTVEATQPGDSNHHPALSVTRSFQVDNAPRQSQTLTFMPLPDRTQGDAPFTVTATASSGLVVTFTSLSSGVCSVTTATVTITNPGTCVIRASQSGNAAFNPAPDLDRSFTVAVAPDTTPDAFTFGQRSNVMPGSIQTSAIVAIQGINRSAPITIAGGLYSLGCDANFVATASSVGVRQSLCVRHTAATGFNQSVTTTVTIGGVAGTFVSRTMEDPALVDPRGDFDGDGIPNAVERELSLDVLVKDNDIFGDTELARRLFVMQLFRDVLGREADAAGLNFWMSQLATAGIGRPQIVVSFLAASETERPTAQAARLFFASYNRAPDPQALSALTEQLRRDGALGAAQSLVTSDEFRNRYGDLDNGGFVDAMFRNVLGRAPDAAGRAFWVAQMGVPNNVSRAQVLLAFADSIEHRSAIEAEVAVTRLYTEFLRRPADNEGFAFWVRQMETGARSLVIIVDAFVRTPDYRQRFVK